MRNPTLPNIKTIPEDVYALFDPNVHHECSEENLQAFATNIVEQVKQRLAKHEPAENTIRFSNLGKPDRVHWYKANGVKGEEMTGKTLLKFTYGAVIEELLLLLIKEAGHVVEDEQLEIEVDGVLGHIDARIDGVICDVKSAAPYSYQKFENGSLFENDAFGYIQQLSGYDAVLEGGGPPAFIAFDKVGGDICTLSIPKETVQKNDPVERIKRIKEAIKQDQPPPRCYPDEPDGKSGNMKLGTQCSYCEFKKTCWPEVRTFLYGNGPRFLTRVVRTPDVFEAR